jgi:imidazolonepropionase-like amidohydrolase
MRSTILALGVLIFAAPDALRAEPPSLIAIRNAKVVTVSGTTIEKGTVVLRDGLIADVGANANVPAAAYVIDGNGLTVYPGLIDGLSAWGIPEAAAPAAAAQQARGAGQRQAAPATPPGEQPQRARGPEDRPATTSWLKAADLVRPTDRRLESARAAGFTTAVTFPKQGIIAGHGAVVNLAGERAGSMVVHPSAGLYLTLQSGGFASFPGSLMGVLSYIKQVWLDAAHYRMAKEAYAKNARMQRPEYDRALEGVLEAQRILLPAATRVQLERMTRFVAQLGAPAVIYGAHEGYRAAAILKQAGTPVVLNIKWPVKSRDADPEEEESYRTLEVRDKAPSTPAALAEAGVKFAVSSDGLETPREMLRALKKSIDAGLKPDQAVRALTLSAAEIYGVADRLGSIERGKIANLTVVRGDLFDEKAKVEMVFIDGVKHLPAPEAPPGPGAGPGGRPGGEGN